MEAIDVLEKAKLDVRAAEQACWQSSFQHAAHPCLAAQQCCRMQHTRLWLPGPQLAALQCWSVQCTHTWQPGSAAACGSSSPGCLAAAQQVPRGGGQWQARPCLAPHLHISESSGAMLRWRHIPQLGHQIFPCLAGHQEVTRQEGARRVLSSGSSSGARAQAMVLQQATQLLQCTQQKLLRCLQRWVKDESIIQNGQLSWVQCLYRCLCFPSWQGDTISKRCVLQAST